MALQEWCIDATKNKLADIMATVVEKHPNVRLRLAYVGYRDHCDEKQFEMMPFTDQEPVKTLRTFLAPVEAYGGGDGPEDVVGGERARFIFHFSTPVGLSKYMLSYIK